MKAAPPGANRAGTTPASAEAPVPLLDLALAHRAIAEELKRDFERVLASGQFILGAEHDAFERELIVLARAVSEARCSDQWPGVDIAACRAQRCGFVRACDGSPGATKIGV